MVILNRDVRSKTNITIILRKRVNQKKTKRLTSPRPRYSEIEKVQTSIGPSSDSRVIDYNRSLRQRVDTTTYRTCRHNSRCRSSSTTDRKTDLLGKDDGSHG
ncbi:Hypothetical predicted protein [Marmota monax]|uniref:Uncharacterized protein n=1 Tax=Marmota monax TaxID=9995 RepID=A0A5E4D122_MARMO|nr:Hypothetical predicted protein [Marmota monax]